MPTYVDVILPLALPKALSYELPEQATGEVAVGMRVVVPLGKRKLYTGIVERIYQAEELDHPTKKVIGREDDYPLIGPKQLSLWNWIAGYYFCTTGEVMNAALPAGLKLESEMQVQRNGQAEWEEDSDLSDGEYLIMEALQTKPKLSIREIAEITEMKNPLRLIKDLLSRQYIFLSEEFTKAYRPRQRRMVFLPADFQEADINAGFEKIGRADKQRELFLAFFRYAGIGEKMVAATLLKKAQASEAALQGLVKKGLLVLEYQIEEPPEPEVGETRIPALSGAQEAARQALKKGWQKQSIQLLHGVTSSGKTEVYAHLAQDILKQGKQVLYLVPEIALTTQLITRLKAYFGDQLLVYHSRFSDRERSATWLSVSKGDGPQIIIGARSAVLLPFQNLGLIIVDEEHEVSYKQFEPAPRYHARDTALVLAKQFGAPVLLGSATPAVDTYFKAQSGKYGLVELHQRYGAVELPEVELVNMREMRFKRQTQGHFSQRLIEAMEQTLKQGRQIILFQNRRGFSAFMQCETCGKVVECKNCDISLTYHRQQHLLRCHYCGYHRNIPRECPSCKSPRLKAMGFGTEKIEDDLKLMFPEAKVQRMDWDTTRKKRSYEEIIAAFEDEETDILVGTQMVTKGLDFKNVGLVGIMNADGLLFFPDFRAHERAFQMLAQVSGRAGRAGERGKVIIQSSDPSHPVLPLVQQNRYRALYEREAKERMEYRYPPYLRLIRVTFKHRKQEVLEPEARQIAGDLRRIFGNYVLGPEYPLAARLRNMYQMEVLIKIPAQWQRSAVKHRLRKVLDAQAGDKERPRLAVVVDVDPV